MFMDKLVSLVADLARVDVMIGPLSPNGQLALVPMGGSFDDRTLDGDKIRTFTFQVLTKDKSQLEAFRRCEVVVEGLDGLSNRDLDDVKLIKLECTTTTNFVEKDTDQQFIYTALFKAEYGGR